MLLNINVASFDQIKSAAANKAKGLTGSIASGIAGAISGVSGIAASFAGSVGAAVGGVAGGIKNIFQKGVAIKDSIKSNFTGDITALKPPTLTSPTDNLTGLTSGANVKGAKDALGNLVQKSQPAAKQNIFKRAAKNIKDIVKCITDKIKGLIGDFFGGLPTLDDLIPSFDEIGVAFKDAFNNIKNTIKGAIAEVKDAYNLKKLGKLEQFELGKLNLKKLLGCEGVKTTFTKQDRRNYNQDPKVIENVIKKETIVSEEALAQESITLLDDRVENQTIDSEIERPVLNPTKSSQKEITNLTLVERIPEGTPFFYQTFANSPSFATAKKDPDYNFIYYNYEPIELNKNKAEKMSDTFLQLYKLFNKDELQTNNVFEDPEVMKSPWNEFVNVRNVVNNTKISNWLEEGPFAPGQKNDGINDILCNTIFNGVLATDGNTGSIKVSVEFLTKLEWEVEKIEDFPNDRILKVYWKLSSDSRKIINKDGLAYNQIGTYVTSGTKYTGQLVNFKSPTSWGYETTGNDLKNPYGSFYLPNFIDVGLAKSKNKKPYIAKYVPLYSFYFATNSEEFTVGEAFNDSGYPISYMQDYSTRFLKLSKQISKDFLNAYK